MVKLVPKNEIRIKGAGRKGVKKYQKEVSVLPHVIHTCKVEGKYSNLTYKQI